MKTQKIAPHFFSFKLAVRLTLDIAFTILLLCALMYRVTGDAAHEWISVAVCVVCIAHNVLITRIIFCFLSVTIENIILGGSCGIFGFCCFWSTRELFQQRNRVRKAWFPKKEKCTGD